MVVNLVSFGFKHGVAARRRPRVRRALSARTRTSSIDCAPLTGRDRRSCASCDGTRRPREFIDRLTTFLKFALPQYVQEGKSYLTVAIGCTGGRHRSVMVAEALKKSLAGVKGVRLRVKHRDVTELHGLADDWRRRRHARAAGTNC